jgi:hypothetical protein
MRTKLLYQQVLRGERLCQPLDVTYLGDEMLQPYHSFEIQWLARLLIAWSQSLNNKVRTKHCTQVLADYL